MIGISNKSIYAVAALQELDKVDAKSVLKIKEIASRAKIPQNFLEQILLTLKKQGILLSIKGAYGGYRLAKPLSEICLKDILMILESDIFTEITEVQSAGLLRFWREIREQIMEVLEIPLSELKRCELEAIEALNYSI